MSHYFTDMKDATTQNLKKGSHTLNILSMEKFGFQRVSNSPSNPGQPKISHSRPIPPQNHHHAAPGRHIKRTLKAANCPLNDVILANCVAVNPSDFDGVPDRSNVIFDAHYVYSIFKHPEVAPGTVGLGANVRVWGAWSLEQDILVETYNIFEAYGGHEQYLSGLDVIVDFRSARNSHSNPISHDDLVDRFVSILENQVLQPTQQIVMEYKGVVLLLVVNSVQVLAMRPDGPSIEESTDLDVKGILTRGKTEVVFYPKHKSVMNLVKPAKLQGKKLGAGVAHSRTKKQIINPDFKLEDLGIGGLDSEFQDIFRRAFNSRILPPEIAEKLDYKHCKGLLLYGPPGTGKTLIARKLSKMLNGREPKIVNGPEMLSKYVGASEENIRNLFKEAEAEYKQKGDDSDLHVIIFDELDSVFKQRGSAKSDGTGVGDNVVNQLLSKMDGVDQLNNILIIGMTNRLDLIDNALLRPGRFEIQIEIALPDEKGRYDILHIHTAKMRENNLLAKDVDFHELAVLTKNFTGAELEGLCNSAKSFAISRHTKKGSVALIDLSSINLMKVGKDDFLLALKEVKPAFGTDEEDIRLQAPYGIIQYNQNINDIFTRGQSFVDEIKGSETENLISILLHGPPGVGKTAVAATLALNSGFPFIKMLSAEGMVGMSEPAKIAHIDNVFRDVYKSPLNILVIDKIETLINYVPIGPRFSNEILQLLLVYLTKKPPKNRKLLIIGTTSQYSVLKHMNLTDCFTNLIAIPSIKSVEEVGTVLTKLGYKSQEHEKNVIMGELRGFNLDIGIKRLLQVLMNCKYLKSDAQGVVDNIIESQSA